MKKSLEQQAADIVKNLLSLNIKLLYVHPGEPTIALPIESITHVWKAPLQISVKSVRGNFIFSVPIRECYHSIMVVDYLGHYLPVISIHEDTVSSNISDIPGVTGIYKIKIINTIDVKPGHYIGNINSPIVSVNIPCIVLANGINKTLDHSSYEAELLNIYSFILK